MKKILLIATTICLLAASPASAQRAKRLFRDRGMKSWTPYLQLASLEPKHEFHVRKGFVRMSGQYGYIRTDDLYENYELSVEWRWPGEPSNSGIFLHVQSEFKIWPENFECQLRAGDAGDIYPAGGSSCNESRENPELVVIPKRNPSNEKPTGEWNHARIVCQGDTISVWINGEFQNQVTGLSSKIGSIGLQSEGKAVEFRNVTVRSLMSQREIQARKKAESQANKAMMKEEMAKAKEEAQKQRATVAAQQEAKRKNEMQERERQREFRQSQRKKE